jgi:hypothetical protein
LHFRRDGLEHRRGCCGLPSASFIKASTVLGINAVSLQGMLPGAPTRPLMRQYGQFKSKTPRTSDHDDYG